ncbi:MAG: penicillin-binding protein activator, partial [Proteobacteria bacterium]
MLTTPRIRSLGVRLTLLTSLLAVGACNFTPPRQGTVTTPVVSAPMPEAPVSPPATATPLGQESQATSPWDSVTLARQASGTRRYAYMLDAIEGFLDLGQAATARTLLEQLDAEPLPQPMEIRRRILLARSHFEEQQYARVESILAPLGATPGIDADSASDIMMLRARSLAAVDNPKDALRLLTQREPLLTDPDEVAENQDTIWRVLAMLDVGELSALRDDGSRRILGQWADLALLSQQLGWNPHAFREQMQRWRQTNPSHPASRDLIPRTLERLGDSLTQYRKVALLLPLSSGFGAAAQAVYDGFSLMYEADTNPRKPLVTLYDTGENAELIGFYYQAAVRDGAELVLGPLGKVAVDALAAADTELTVPTLLLGNTDASYAGRRNVFQFGLSPEDEARQVARKAFAEGHRVAAILYPETDWGLRQLDAFSSMWRSLGGTVAETNVYQAEGQDHSQAIKLMLNLDESETRHRRLEGVVGSDLHFVPKRREDLDFVFMIARSNQGRLLKPQINFHKGQGLAVYAISQVYSARNETVKDIDLDGVVFGDMPWLLLDGGINRAIRQDLPNGGKYLHDPLDRLFALGIDTYQLLFRLEAMKANPLLEFQGATGLLSLAPDGSIARQL